jgi:aspartyl protease family protein
MLGKLAVVAFIGAVMAAVLLWPTARKAPPPAGKAEATEVVVARSEDRHYYVDAKVNGRSVRFMLDTGSSETVLTEADAESAGIRLDPDKYVAIGEGASGMVRGQYVQLGSLDLEGVNEKDMKVVVVPGANVSLLGQDFLDKVDEIVIAHGEMHLRREPN